MVRRKMPPTKQAPVQESGHDARNGDRAEHQELTPRQLAAAKAAEPYLQQAEMWVSKGKHDAAKQRMADAEKAAREAEEKFDRVQAIKEGAGSNFEAFRASGGITFIFMNALGDPDNYGPDGYFTAIYEAAGADKDDFAHNPDDDFEIPDDVKDVMALQANTVYGAETLYTPMSGGTLVQVRCDMGTQPGQSPGEDKRVLMIALPD